MNKPYNWREEETDTFTKNRIDEFRQDEPQPEPALWVSADYPDSSEYKCPKCGRAKPCRRHRNN